MNAQNATTETGKKICVAHGSNDQAQPKPLPVSQFDANPLTHDGLHTCCRSCSTPADTAFRIARATRLLNRAGVSPRSPISMAVGSEPVK